MSNYLIIANTVRPFGGKPIPAAEVYDLMMRHGCWEYTDSAPCFKRMKKGDTLFFYLAGQRARYIAGEAVVAGEPLRIEDSSPVTFDREQVPFFAWRLPLKGILRYPPKAVGLEALKRLSFAVESDVPEKYFGLLIRVGVREITVGDAEVLRSQSGK
jgi:hypothetical protein